MFGVDAIRRSLNRRRPVSGNARPAAAVVVDSRAARQRPRVPDSRVASPTASSSPRPRRSLSPASSPTSTRDTTASASPVYRIGPLTTAEVTNPRLIHAIHTPIAKAPICLPAFQTHTLASRLPSARSGRKLRLCRVLLPIGANVLVICHFYLR